MYCRSQLGQLADMQDRLAKKGIGLAAISVDEREDSVTFARQIGAKYPLLLDDGLRVSMAYGVAMQGRDIPVPAVFVVLPNGTIFWRKVGESVSDRPSIAELNQVIDRAIVASGR
ncbi:MAG: redoxin domain-containing protein [Minicystis sp.]